MVCQKSIENDMGEKKISSASYKILDLFNIRNNFTPEEKAELHRDKDWAFQDNNLMSFC